jgi:hypothetical protein
MIKVLKYIIVIALFPSCGVTFTTQSLNSSAENAMNYSAMKAEHKESFKDFSSKTIYQNTTSDEVWGMESDACHTFKFTEDIVYEGKRAIQLEWNTKNKDCQWLGIGFGWDGWSGKSIGDIMFSSAIELKIRSIKGESPALPIIVFLLEDYSSTNSAVGIQSQFLERSVIDEDWQTLTVPLYLFNFDNAEGDAFNVKQLKLELQGEGSVIIDDIKIVEYETSVSDLAKVYDPKAERSYKSPFKKFKESEIFAGDMSSVWGAEKDNCKDIKGDPIDAITSNALSIQWNNENQKQCNWIGMGFSWDNYNPKDLTPVLKNAAIEMSVKAPKGKTLYSIPIVALIEDYNGKQCATVPNSINFTNPPFTDKWQKVYIPLTDFDYEKIGVDMSNVKQLNFQFLGSGELFLDDIKLVPYEKKEKPKNEQYFLKDQLPVSIFKNSFGEYNAWGFINNNCRNFQTTQSQNGDNTIKLSWDFVESNCTNKSFGVSWSKWEAVSFDGLKGNEFLQFNIINASNAKFKVGFENYSGHRNQIEVKGSYITKTGKTSTVKIPLIDILSLKEFNTKNIKQLLFTFQEKGSVEIDNIIIQ